MDAAIRMHIAAAPADLATLANCLRGEVVTPADPGYSDAARVWNEAHQGAPMAVVRVADAGDVATAVDFARTNGIELAVRAGGHSVAGHSSGDGVLVIDLRDLRAIHLDPASGSVWAGAGLTAGDLVSALAPHGLTVPFGDTGSVGIGGITLGGGIGYLVRKHGLTIDSLLAVEIVTADGVVVTASAHAHADLFWAVRGGGGNVGIVTRFRYQAHPVAEIYGGAMVLPLTRDVLRGLMPIALGAPDELSVIANVMDLPPIPFLPEAAIGQRGVLLMLAWNGDPARGEAAVAPFRQLATPLGEMLGPMPYAAIYALSEGAGEPHASTIRSAFLPALTDASVDAILAALKDAPPHSMIQLRGLGGAMARVPAEETAFAQRDASVLLAVINGLGPEGADEVIAWNRELFERASVGATGVYANFLEDEGDARIRAAYPRGAYERLAAIKRRYDPSNLLRRNQNVPPA